MLARLHAAAGTLSRLLLILCCAMLVVMTATIGTLVVTRYVFSYSFPWAEELTRYLLVWMVLLAASIVQRRDDHIRVDFLVSLLPARVQLVIGLCLRCLIIGFTILLLRYGWTAAMGMNITTTPSLGISMTIPYLAIPICGGLMLAFSLLSLIDDLRELAGRGRLQPDKEPV